MNLNTFLAFGNTIIPCYKTLNIALSNMLLCPLRNLPPFVYLKINLLPEGFSNDLNGVEQRESTTGTDSRYCRF